MSWPYPLPSFHHQLKCSHGVDLPAAGDGPGRMSPSLFRDDLYTSSLSARATQDSSLHGGGQ